MRSPAISAFVSRLPWALTLLALAACSSGGGSSQEGAAGAGAAGQAGTGAAGTGSAGQAGGGTSGAAGQAGSGAAGHVLGRRADAERLRVHIEEAQQLLALVLVQMQAAAR